MQGVPVYERMSARPQPLNLPMPGPHEAYHGDCAEYRPIPGGGPADDPASHWGEVVYAGNHQVDHDQEECVPPIEELAPPGAGPHTCGALTDLAHALLLCMFHACGTLGLRSTLHAARYPKGHQLYY